MGRRQSGALPGIRLHKPTGHARVRINGTEHWLGRYGSPEAQLKYDELVAAYIASGRKSVEAATRPAAPPPAATATPADITVVELALRWLRHIADTRGQASSTYSAGLVAARALHDVQALPARDFGPRRLLEVRAAFAAQSTIYRNKKGEITAQKPRTRRYVNDTMARIVQMFSWAATMELVPGDKPAALREVAPLRALVQFCRLTGCRPGEAARLRLDDVHDRDRPVWRYVPAQHKNAWRCHSRHIAIGPRAQAVVLEALAGRSSARYGYASASGQGRAIGRATLVIETGSISGGRSLIRSRRGLSGTNHLDGFRRKSLTQRDRFRLPVMQIPSRRSFSTHEIVSVNPCASVLPRSHDTSRIAWAKLMARVGEKFPLECPNCGGDIRLIAFITEPGPIRKILTHLGEPLEPLPLAPARGPPTEWGELVQAHDDRAFFKASPDELPAIDIHSL